MERPAGCLHVLFVRPKKLSIDTLLFDLDGTLTDPREGILGCIRHALARLGRKHLPTDEELAWCIGPPLRVSYQRILQTEDPQLIERAVEYYRERYRGPGKFENRVYDGIPEALARLKNKGYRMLVCTAKPAVYANDIVRHFGLAPYFDGLYGADLGGKLDHKPDLLAHLLRTERLDPKGCLMIGDRKHDVLAAKENGARCLGVLWGYGSAEELTEAGADALCESPHDLAKAVDKLASVS